MDAKLAGFSQSAEPVASASKALTFIRDFLKLGPNPQIITKNLDIDKAAVKWADLTRVLKIKSRALIEDIVLDLESAELLALAAFLVDPRIIPQQVRHEMDLAAWIDCIGARTELRDVARNPAIMSATQATLEEKLTHITGLAVAEP